MPHTARLALWPLHAVAPVSSVLRPRGLSVASAVQCLRHRLDARVVGHGDAKEALLLALLAREHVLLEGPPGSAKTLLAEELSRAAGVAPFVAHLHRDVRTEDLLSRGGVLHRQQTADGGELISHRVIPGGVLAADVCDDHRLQRVVTGACDAMLPPGLRPYLQSVLEEAKKKVPDAPQLPRGHPAGAPWASLGCKRCPVCTQPFTETPKKW